MGGVGLDFFFRPQEPFLPLALVVLLLILADRGKSHYGAV